MSEAGKMPVSLLQERAIRSGRGVQYRVVKEHSRGEPSSFTIRVCALGKVAMGTGSSKQAARHAAARALLGKLDAKPETQAKKATKSNKSNQIAKSEMSCTCEERPIGRQALEALRDLSLIIFRQILEQIEGSEQWLDRQYMQKLRETFELTLKPWGRQLTRTLSYRRSTVTVTWIVNGRPLSIAEGTGANDVLLEADALRTIINGFIEKPEWEIMVPRA